MQVKALEPVCTKPQYEEFMSKLERHLNSAPSRSCVSVGRLLDAACFSVGGIPCEVYYAVASKRHKAGAAKLALQHLPEWQSSRPAKLVFSKPFVPDGSTWLAVYGPSKHANKEPTAYEVSESSIAYDQHGRPLVAKGFGYSLKGFRGNVQQRDPVHMPVWPPCLGGVHIYIAVPGEELRARWPKAPEKVYNSNYISGEGKPVTLHRAGPKGKDGAGPSHAQPAAANESGQQAESGALTRSTSRTASRKGSSSRSLSAASLRSRVDSVGVLVPPLGLRPARSPSKTTMARV